MGLCFTFQETKALKNDELRRDLETFQKRSQKDDSFLHRQQTVRTLERKGTRLADISQSVASRMDKVVQESKGCTS
jgi:hypothetical protein